MLNACLYAALDGLELFQGFVLEVLAAVAAAGVIAGVAGIWLSYRRFVLFAVLVKEMRADLHELRGEVVQSMSGVSALQATLAALSADVSGLKSELVMLRERVAVSEARRDV